MWPMGLLFKLRWETFCHREDETIEHTLWGVAQGGLRIHEQNRNKVITYSTLLWHNDTNGSMKVVAQQDLWLVLSQWDL